MSDDRRYAGRRPGAREGHAARGAKLGRAPRFIVHLWERFRESLSPGRLGPSGEELAARHLKGLGYRILARNYRVKGGEADILAADGGRIVVVEVKTRRSTAFGTPAEAVTPRKMRRVLLAGQVFCRRNGYSLSRLRGDVVAVMYDAASASPHIRHYEGALRRDR